MIILSDLHLEHHELVLTGSRKSKIPYIWICAGDVHPHSEEALKYFKKYLEMYKLDEIIFVLGNHDYWGRTIEETIKFWKNVDLNRFTFLQNNSKVVKGIKFWGSTFWTNFKTEKSNDDKMIKDFNYDHEEMKTEKWNQEHRKARDSLLKELDDNEQINVITHHLPIEACVSPEYVGHSHMYNFTSVGLENLFTKKINTWIHGHTHSKVDLLQNGVKIKCNPRGYPFEHSVFKKIFEKIYNKNGVKNTRKNWKFLKKISKCRYE